MLYTFKVSKNCNTMVLVCINFSAASKTMLYIRLSKHSKYFVYLFLECSFFQLVTHPEYFSVPPLPLVGLFEYLFMFQLHWHLPTKQALNTKQSAKWYERITRDISRRSGYFSLHPKKVEFPNVLWHNTSLDILVIT